MPYKYKSKKTKPKSKKKINRKKVIVKRQPLLRRGNLVDLGKGFPAKLAMTHVYDEMFLTLTGTTGAPGYYKFIANGLYDPNYTGAGHQPYYFDQLSALYNHYHVIGSKIEVTFTPTSSAMTPAMVGIVLTDDTTLAANNISELIEFDQNLSKKAISLANGVSHKLTSFFSTKKQFGPSILSNNALRGNISSNPTEQSVFNVFIQSMDGLSTVSCYLSVKITFMTVWTELKDISQS